MKRVILLCGLLLLIGCDEDRPVQRPRLGMHIDRVLALKGWTIKEDDIAWRRNWSRYSATKITLGYNEYLWLTFENDTLVNIQNRRTL